ncbi:MAG TPA: PilZ domain-containing protein [Candidatus Dormibacteraeota bacterium]|nr:PilZ domain-containing protein [Candidatus Dormibacteraeota bacterium]
MTANPGSSESPANRRRSQRVLLRLPIKVTLRGPGIVTASEETVTQVVNAHGALIYLKLKVSAGQFVAIKNTSTDEEHVARVVRTKLLDGEMSEVALEFMTPAPKFWRISFPPSDWESQPEEPAPGQKSG